MDFLEQMMFGLGPEGRVESRYIEVGKVRVPELRERDRRTAQPHTLQTDWACAVCWALY